MTDGPVVETRSGRVRGRAKDGHVEFRGVPFAAPPVIERRFLAPQREEPWTGERDATGFVPMALQQPGLMESMLNAGPRASSEDCLGLNVFTPAADDRRRPVMVWIHGGAFVSGSGSIPWYHGTGFVERGDVVVVTVNYRLGAPGFLYLAGLIDDERVAGSGNNGIRDQVAALGWVQECIGAFGGDPGDVTVFGESAGSMSISTLLGTPSARGRLHKAIMQSGSATRLLSVAHAEENAARFVHELGLGDARGAALLDALQQVPSDRLLEAQGRMPVTVGRARLPWSPVHDGVVLPDPPLAAIAAGSAAGVPIIIGTNRDEMTLFNLADPKVAGMTDADLERRLEGFLAHGEAADVIEPYRRNRPRASAGEVWTAIASDAVFRIPSIRTAEAQLAHAPVWMYRFDWASPAFGGMLKAAHAMEIPFVFDILDQHGTQMFTGGGADRQPIADAMHAAWTAFARTGDPNHEGGPPWPRYDRERRATMLFDAPTRVADDPSGDERAAWDRVRLHA